MTSVRVAAVQASYVLMDQAATLDRVGELTAAATAQGAQLVAFPIRGEEIARECPGSHGEDGDGLRRGEGRGSVEVVAQQLGS
jgi:Carbon-nitrogen hydrolase